MIGYGKNASFLQLAINCVQKSFIIQACALNFNSQISLFLK